MHDSLLLMRRKLKSDIILQKREAVGNDMTLVEVSGSGRVK